MKKPTKDNEATKEDNIHAAHRERVRKKVLKNGFGYMENHELLELILFYSIPRADTNPLAHKLLKRFGSLLDIVSSRIEELKTVYGVGDETAIYLSAIGELYRRTISEAPKVFMLNNDEVLKEYASSLFKYAKEEMLYLICVDSNLYHVATVEIGMGNSIGKVNVDISKLTEAIITYKPNYISLTHNHLNGSKIFSQEDVKATLAVLKIVSIYDTIFDDHILVCGDEVESMKNLGAIQRINNLAAQKYTNSQIEDIVASELSYQQRYKIT